ncbi:stemmadenine O-acetyltransferase-like [Silene latifolia]|uniref:stemmadenine O-acetyltransferase-like n=1 Tax=Silene latifolia TaxID=37657 RepID=UPI003D76E312
MESSKFEVKIISTEIVKPSSPTPSHLRHLTLSLLDQKYAPLTVPVLLLYSGASNKEAQLDITVLKTCLSKTLSSFYPLAGRFQTWASIVCNDEGIPFVEAQVNCPISDVLNSISSSTVDLRSFYPPKDNLIVSGINLAIQVNVFSCGGFAIGWYHTHKVTDGTSAATFFRHWAALVAQRYDDKDLTKPDFISGPTAFPPVPEEQPLPLPISPKPELDDKKEETKEETKGEKKGSWSFLFNKQIVLRSFVFKNKSITEMKAKSVSDRVPNPTRFEALAGFLWKSILSASQDEGRTMLNFPVNLRARTEPPLPVVSMGNLFETLHVQSERTAQLPELVAKIHESITNTKNLAMEYQGENRGEAKAKHWKNFINGVFECKGKDAYVITPWCKSAGFSDVDFGFGFPKRVVPVDDIVNHNQRNTIFLTDVKDEEGDGFEAWMFLEEEPIKFLETNKEFLAFASPNF